MTRRTGITARRILLGVSLFLGALPARADLLADTGQVLRRLADDPDATLKFQTVSAPSLHVEGEMVRADLEGLAIVPKANPASGLFVGNLTLQVRRRADGGIEATAALPEKMTFKGIASATDSLLEIGNGRLTLGWGKDLDEVDEMALSVDSLTGLDGGKPVLAANRLAFNHRRDRPDGASGAFSFSLGEIEDLRGGAPVPVKGLNSLLIEGRYEDFPYRRQRLLARHLLYWEQARAIRGGVQVNLGLFQQELALLQEARAHYVIEKFSLKAGAAALQAEVDFRFSLEAAQGFYGRLTAWVLDPPQAPLPDPANPMVTMGSHMAVQFGESGKTPEGAEAHIFRIELAEDGKAMLNGQESPGLALGIGNAVKAFALGLNGGTIPVAGQIAGATGCGVPVYPAESLKAQESGMSVLSFDYDAQGAVQMTHIKSSGFSRLDEAARLAYISCRFPPGTTSAVIPIVWKIENGRGASMLGPGLTVTTK